MQPEFRIDRWTTGQGLPDNRIYALLQGRDGYLWIGTGAGLARFDGLKFLVYGSKDSTTMTATNRIVSALLEDDEGVLWIGTSDGLLRRSGVQIVESAGSEALHGIRINALHPRESGGFWVGSDRGLGYVEKGSFSWVSELGTGRVISITESQVQGLWIGRADGIRQFDPVSGIVTQSHLKTLRIDGQIHDNIKVVGLHLDRRGTLWIGSNFGAWRLPEHGREPIPAHHPERGELATLVYARFAEDFAGRIWATSTSATGTALYNPTDSTVRKLSYPQLEYTTCVAADREGVVWMGSREGLFRLVQRPFTLLGMQKGAGEACRWHSIVEGGDGSLWFGGLDSVVNWTGRDLRRFLFFLKSGSSLEPTLMPRADGGVVALCSSGARIEIPFVNEPGSAPSIDHDRLPGSEVLWAHCRASDGTHYLGSSGGLCRWENDGSVSRVDQVPRCRIRTLYSGESGEIWIGTEDIGLCRLDSQQFRTVVDAGDSGAILAILGDSGGFLWLGLRAGLGLFEQGEFRRCPLDSGKLLTEVRAILADDFNDLWLSHDSGVMRIRRRDIDLWRRGGSNQISVTEFGVEDGLGALDGTTGPQSALKGRDGRLWFLNYKGLAMVDPAALFRDVPAPEVIIEAIEADGVPKPLMGRPPIGAARKLRLQFAATSLCSPEKVRVQYHLKGLDSGWIEAGLNRV
ncbi:MAG: two-component regulator propeller domain-containing protein [Limisphaerales bacterium]